MQRKITAVYIALVLCACAGSAPVIVESAPPPPVQTDPVSSQPVFWITVPRPGALVVIGVSGTQLDPEMEIDIAREDAARKVAMYHGIHIQSEYVQSIGSGFLDYYVDSASVIEYDQEIEKYSDKLVFDPEQDVIKMNNAVFVRFSYPAAFPGTIPYSFAKNADGSPEWTTRRPREIGGLSAGVGFARRQLKTQDTFIKSYEAAAGYIVSQNSASIVSSETSVDNQNLSVIHQRSTGTLTNFVILETWVEPGTQAVWTLAVAQSAE